MWSRALQNCPLFLFVNRIAIHHFNLFNFLYFCVKLLLFLHIRLSWSTVLTLLCKDHGVTSGSHLRLFMHICIRSVHPCIYSKQMMFNSLPTLYNADRERCCGRWEIREARKLNASLEGGSNSNPLELRHKYAITVSSLQRIIKFTSLCHSHKCQLQAQTVIMQPFPPCRTEKLQWSFGWRPICLDFLSLSLCEDWVRWEDEKVLRWFPNCNQKASEEYERGKNV